MLGLIQLLQDLQDATAAQKPVVTCRYCCQVFHARKHATSNRSYTAGVCMHVAAAAQATVGTAMLQTYTKQRCIQQDNRTSGLFTAFSPMPDWLLASGNPTAAGTAADKQPLGAAILGP
jgi:hypothetical protein